ncbi:MAG: PEP-CTERM sorting domain-containing protein [Gammaproteobacteria bacterium]
MRRLIFALLVCALLGFTGALQAATVTYILGDHPDAALYQTNPTDPYGLRVDAAPPPGTGPTFSVGTNLGGLGGPVTLSWDDSLAGSATLSGTLERNDDGTFWTVSYILTGLAAAPNGGITATGGSGSVDEIGGALRSISLTGMQDAGGYAFIFDDDGHRLAAPAGWVGRGWLAGSGTTVDDWIVTAQIVPVPAAVWLFGSALGLMGLARRRRS